MKKIWVIGAFLSIIAGTACPLARAADPPDAGLIATVGGAAEEAIKQLEKPDLNKLRLLRALAAAQIKLGDLKAARRTLETARSIQLEADVVSDIAVLSDRAGDLKEAVEYLQKTSVDSQVSALGKLTASLVEAGKLTDAAGTIALLEALRARFPQEGFSKAPDTSGRQSLGQIYERALSNIGKAFAKRRDITRALKMAEKISDNGERASLLGEIARAQQETGDQQASADTLRRAMKEIEDELPANSIQRVRLEAFTLVRAGTVNEVLRAVLNLPEKEGRGSLYRELVDAYIRDDDFARAGEIAEASGNPQLFASVGQSQLRAGDEAAAHRTFTAAYETLKRQPEVTGAVRSGHISSIAAGLVSVGAFADAISISAELDRLNRLMLIVSAIREEAKRGDKQALGQTVPIALEIVQAGIPANMAELPGLARALARAGYADEAKTVLAQAEKNMDGLSAWERMEALKNLKVAQSESGDRGGAERTRQAIRREIVVFKEGLERKASQGGDVARVAEAMMLMHKLGESNDPKADEQSLKRAAELLGKDASQQFGSLMLIAGRYSSQQQAMDLLDEEIGLGDFTSATRTAGTLNGRRRDMGFRNLAWAEIRAGELKPAFEAANEIVNPSQRASLLISILDAVPQRP